MYTVTLCQVNLPATNITVDNILCLLYITLHLYFFTYIILKTCSLNLNNIYRKSYSVFEHGGNDSFNEQVHNNNMHIQTTSDALHEFDKTFIPIKNSAVLSSSFYKRNYFIWSLFFLSSVLLETAENKNKTQIIDIYREHKININEKKNNFNNSSKNSIYNDAIIFSNNINTVQPDNLQVKLIKNIPFSMFLTQSFILLNLCWILIDEYKVCIS